MRTAVILCFMILGAMCSRNVVQQRSLSEKNSKTIIEELKKSQFGKALLKMTELHSAAHGPLEELVSALEELIQDLNNDLQELEFDFQHRTNQHNALVVKLTQEIQDADIDINRAEDLIDNLLAPRKESLISRIEQIQDYQVQNRQNLAENTLVREQDHASYEAQVEELNSATESVDEALSLIATLSNPSLVQVKKFQVSLKKIEAKISKRGTLSPMIKALISLASNQNFSNQDIVKAIADALNEFRNEVVNSLNDLSANEKASEAEFLERCDQLDSELAAFGRQIVALTVHLTATVEKIDQTLAFQSSRVADKKSYQAQFDLENEQYAEETEIYTNMKNENLRELAVCEQALTVVSSVDLSGIKMW